MNANTLDEMNMEHSLLTAGWKRVHASPFWRAPSGFVASSTSHAHECLKTGAHKFKHCPHCGQQSRRRSEPQTKASHQKRGAGNHECADAYPRSGAKGSNQTDSALLANCWLE